MLLSSRCSPAATTHRHLIIFWPIFQEMMEHPLTDTWNETFMGEWVSMHEAGLLEGVPVRLD